MQTSQPCWGQPPLWAWELAVRCDWDTTAAQRRLSACGRVQGLKDSAGRVASDAIDCCPRFGLFKKVEEQRQEGGSPGCFRGDAYTRLIVPQVNFSGTLGLENLEAGVLVEVGGKGSWGQGRGGEKAGDWAGSEGRRGWARIEGEKRSGKMPSEAEKCEPGAQEHQGKEGHRGVFLPPKCPICVFPTNGAVSFLPSKSEDPNSMTFKIMNETHLLLGTAITIKLYSLD